MAAEKAALAVMEFFERVSDGGCFDASHLRKFWAALCTDKNTAGAQLAKCLLVYISAPEMHEVDRHVPRCMKEWAAIMPAGTPTLKSDAEDVIGALLAQLAEWIPQRHKHSRVRVVDLLVSILRGLRGDTTLEDQYRTTVVESLHDHLADKEEKVRELVVIALSKVAFFEDDEGNTQATVEGLVSELTDALHSDISQDVRTELVNRLPLDRSTLSEVLRHQSDRAAKVAAAVYDRVAREVPMVQPSRPGGVAASPDQRRSLLWCGLQEPRPEVREAAQRLLVRWFQEGAGRDVVALVEALKPRENAELCRLVLERLVALGEDGWDPQAWLKAETAVDRSLRALAQVAEQYQLQQQNGSAGGSGSSDGGGGGAPWLQGVSPALVFVWRFAAGRVDEVATDTGRAAAAEVGAAAAQAEASAGAQAEMTLENFLPTAQQMAQLCLLVAAAGPSYRYVAAQLLELTTLSYMNWVDASSRDAAEEVLAGLITRVCSPDGAEPSGRTAPRDPFQSAGSGGSGAWEAAVLRFAGGLYGADGAGLVRGVLPLVLQLAEGADGHEYKGQYEAGEARLLQALTYLHLLMVAAGPAVPPAATAPAPRWQQQRAAGGASAGANGGGVDEEPVEGRSLAQAVDGLAWTACGHVSPAVRAAAVRCCVELCLRDGGLAYLPRAAAVLFPMLPTSHHGGGGAAAAGDKYDRDDNEDFAARQQLPRRLALQGLMDLAQTWGEPAVTAELRRAAAAVVGQRRVEAVAERLAAMGMEVDGGAAAEAKGREQRTDGGNAVAAGPSDALGVVPILLRLTEGVARKMQGSDGYVAARGAVADALLGSARLVAGWSFTLRLNRRLRYQVVTAMQPRLAEQLLTRLLLARYSPSLESEPWLRGQLTAFFKSFQEAASAPGDEGAVHRRMLAGAFLFAARCAMALPAPAGAPATARGCAAPALMEFAAELLSSSASAAIAAAAEAVEADDDAGDDVASGGGAEAGAAVSGGAPTPAPPPDAVVWLCEVVLEEVVRLGSPGSASLDTSEGRVRAYAAELCKTPSRLLPGLPTDRNPASSGINTIRRLAFLARRAVLTAKESLARNVVPVTAFKKLEEFLGELEELEQVKAKPVSEEDAKAFLEAFRRQLSDRGGLEELPSLEDVTEHLQPDDDWDMLTTDVSHRGRAAAGARGADQAATNKRGAAAARDGAATKTRSGGAAAARSRQGTRFTSGRGGAAAAGATSSRRSDTRHVADTDSSNGDDDSDSSDDDSDSGNRRRQPGGGRAAKPGPGARSSADTGAGARPAASQDTAASGSGAAAAGGGSQTGRRSTRAAAAKASMKLEAMRAGSVRGTVGAGEREE